MTKPPVGLTVEIKAPDGTTKRWASHLPARDRPTNVSFGTARMDGFKVAGLTLPRRVDTDYPDLRLLDDIAFIGADGSVAWEGRVSALPRSMDTDHTVSVQAVGWMAHTRDRKFREIYVDRDLKRWGEPSNARLVNLFGGSGVHTSRGSKTVVPDQSGLARALLFEFARLDSVGGGRRDLIEGWYDSTGIPLGALYYDKTEHQITAADWQVTAFLAEDDGVGANNSSGDTSGSSSAGYVTASGVAKYYSLLQVIFEGTLTADGTWRAYWRKLAVYGTHGLIKRGTDPGGFYASDVIRDVAARFCPKLNTAGVQDTTYVIPHLEFIDPIHPYDAFLRCNGPHLWGLEVWENKTLHYGPVDLTDYDWQVRLSDHGVSVDLQGDSTDDLANGICVVYPDVEKGQQRRLTPDDSSELRDDSVENPANRAGIQVWTEITVSYPTTADMALQMGRAALAEFNSPKAPGTITVKGHIRDRAGHWWPCWKPRAGETVAIVDHANDRPRLIVETSYSHGEVPSIQLSVDATAKRLDAVHDRIETALRANNLV